MFFLKKDNFKIFFDFTNHESLIAILIYLIPLALVTGPFLPDLFLSIVGIYFLLISIYKKLSKYYKNNFVYVFLFFYLYINLTSLLSYNILGSLEVTLFYFRYLFFSLGVWYLFNNVPNFARNLGLCLLITLVVVAVDGYHEWIFGYNVFGWTVNHPSRVSGFFRDELIIGGYLARLVPLCFSMLLFSYGLSKRNILIGLFLLIFFDLIIFGSGERAAFLFITMFSILLIFLSSRFKLYRLITFILSTVIIIFITIYVPSSNLKVKETFVNVTHNNYIPLAPYSSLHEEHYIVALNMFKEKPIFGQGPKMFRELCKFPKFDYKRGCTSHPHNSYLELMAETGFIGFSFLMFIFLLICYLLLKQFLSFFIPIKKIPDYILFLVILLFTMTWPLIPTGSFYNNWTNVMYYFPVGFVLSYYYKKKLL